jgi:ribonuclease T1
MKNNYLQILICLLIGMGIGFFIGKNINSHQQNLNDTQHSVRVEHSKKNSTISNLLNENTHPEPNSVGVSSASIIPQKAYKIWEYVKQHQQAPEGYVGGREFKNRERQLQLKNKHGKILQYQEWDVNPKIEHQNRGAERLITSNDGRAWYTNNHYKTFTELK